MTQPARIAVPDQVSKIHEQGYERYTGPRLEQTNRFWVVARNQIWLGLRRWVVRIPIVLTIFVLLITCVFIFVLEKLAKGAPKNLVVGENQDLTAGVIVEGGKYAGWLGMVIGAGIACGAITDDLKVGAFQFYFSRSIKTIDYAVGKALGVMFLVAIPMLLMPVLASILRVALATDLEEAGKVWDAIPKGIAWGVLGTVAYTIPALGFGAAIAHKRAAQGGYIAYYMVFSTMALVAAKAAKMPWLELFAFDYCWQNVGIHLFDVPRPEIPGMSPSPPWWQSLAALGGYIGLGAWGLVARLRKVEVSSVGGGS